MSSIDSQSQESLTKSNENGVLLGRRLAEEFTNNNNNTSVNLEAEIIENMEDPINLIYHPIEGSSGSFSAVPIFKHVFSPPPPLPPLPLSPVVPSSLPAAQSPSHNDTSTPPPQNTSSATNTPNRATRKSVSGIVGGVFVFASFVAVLFFVCRKKSSIAISPWKTGISGQLQNALVKGKL